MPRIIDIYTNVVEKGVFNGIISPWEKNNFGNSVKQKRVGFPEPYVLRGPQRPGTTEPQEWLGLVDIAASDLERLTKMFASYQGIKFIARQRRLNQFAIRPQANFLGSMLNGPFAGFGSRMPRSVRTSIALKDLSVSNFTGFTLEPSYVYSRDETESNILRLYRQIDTPQAGFVVPTAITAPFSAIGAAVHTSNTAINTEFVKLRGQGGLSQSNFTIGGNVYSDESPYTGSTPAKLPDSQPFKDLYGLADAATSQAFIDFRDLDTSAPELQQAEDNALQDFNGNTTPFDKAPTKYDYQNYNLYKNYGYRRPRRNPGRNFQEPTTDNLTNVNNLSPTEEPTVPDLIDVHFRRSGSGEVLYFQCALQGLSDGVSYNWNQENYVGRIDPVHYFSGVGSRKVQFQLTVTPFSKEEMVPMWRKIQALLRFASPHETTTGQHKGSFLELTLGDYLKNRRGYITDIAITPNEEMYWEANIGNQFDTYQLPRLIELAIGFEIVDTDPTTDRKFFFGESGIDGNRPPSIQWLEWRDYPND